VANEQSTNSPRDPARGTTASHARSQSLRRLYTPTCQQVGGPLKCMAAARLYKEVSVCRDCYEVYARKAAQWQRHPRAFLSVASVPALGLIGTAIADLPDEIRKEVDTSKPAPVPIKDPVLGLTAGPKQRSSCFAGVAHANAER